MLVYYLNVVNAPVKLECCNDLFAAFQRRKVLLVIANRFLQFRNFHVQSVDDGGAILHLQG